MEKTGTELASLKGKLIFDEAVNIGNNCSKQPCYCINKAVESARERVNGDELYSSNRRKQDRDTASVKVKIIIDSCKDSEDSSEMIRARVGNLEEDCAKLTADYWKRRSFKLKKRSLRLISVPLIGSGGPGDWKVNDAWQSASSVDRDAVEAKSSSAQSKGDVVITPVENSCEVSNVGVNADGEGKHRKGSKGSFYLGSDEEEQGKLDKEKRGLENWDGVGKGDEEICANDDLEDGGITPGYVVRDENPFTGHAAKVVKCGYTAVGSESAVPEGDCREQNGQMTTVCGATDRNVFGQEVGAVTKCEVASSKYSARVSESAEPEDDSYEPNGGLTSEYVVKRGNPFVGQEAGVVTESEMANTKYSARVSESSGEDDNSCEQNGGMTTPGCVEREADLSVRHAVEGAIVADGESSSRGSEAEGGRWEQCGGMTPECLAKEGHPSAEQAASGDIEGDECGGQYAKEWGAFAPAQRHSCGSLFCRCSREVRVSGCLVRTFSQARDECPVSLTEILHERSMCKTMGNGASTCPPPPPRGVLHCGPGDVDDIADLIAIKDNPGLLRAEVVALRREVKRREQEVLRLQREVHKLRSVLQQATSFSQDGDLLSMVQEATCMAGQTSSNKKQGVSGESSKPNQTPEDLQIQRYEKDFRSKQLIKSAIMDNDFLKNLDASQVRELVDSMYPRECSRGSYVIREGETGSHLYVSADGEFEVMKEGKVLGRMGAGKAFGELAILYNCTRTASIRVVKDSRVWVLDRRIFQRIMMRTGLQRLEDNLNFLRSVPLLHHLSAAVLAKIADSLQVEFYPAGHHIVRQGASGDTFFILSGGCVKVTQRPPGCMEEDEIRTLERGDYFGEQALLKEECRTASVIALPPGVECLTLDRESFTQLIGDLSELQDKDYGDKARSLSRPPSSNSVHADSDQDLDYVRLDDLDVVATLGVGGFGRVELVQSNFDKTQSFALKCLKKQHIVETQQQEHVYSEKNILISCRSPFICRLYRTFKDTKYVYMLLEACLGGEVWTILRDRNCFDDATACFITACVIEALDYLHSRSIIYRDLKPENLLLDVHGYVKLVDFGFAKRLGSSSKTWTFCGTPEYVAPEIILNKGHDRAVDCWALGILMHELLTGAPPFCGSDPMKTYNLILKGIDLVDFPRHVTRSAQILVKRLCRDAPGERLGYQKGGLADVKKHKWFQGFDWDGLKMRTMQPPIIPQVRGPTDLSNFDTYSKEDTIPPDELSNWDADF